MIKLLIRCNDGIAAIGGSLMGNKLITFRPACCTDQTPIMSQNLNKVNKDKDKGMLYRHLISMDGSYPHDGSYQHLIVDGSYQHLIMDGSYLI